MSFHYLTDQDYKDRLQERAKKVNTSNHNGQHYRSGPVVDRAGPQSCGIDSRRSRHSNVVACRTMGPLQGNKASMKRAVSVLALSLVFGAVTGSSGQVYTSGQDIVPVFEGWEQNRDGTFDLVFGYMNRNREQELYIPVGPDNNLDFKPSGDAGQPTHFYARRQKYVFKLTVPRDWSKK